MPFISPALAAARLFRWPAARLFRWPAFGAPRSASAGMIDMSQNISSPLV
jgi:hypothetical protein